LFLEGRDGLVARVRARLLRCLLVDPLQQSADRWWLLLKRSSIGRRSAMDKVMTLIEEG
jgi:hypothetical protein